MIREEWQQILENKDVRQNLSKIRKELKDRAQIREFLKLLAGDEDKLIALLASEDPKTRKNTALMMGDLGKKEFLDSIWKAYLDEPQRFVKSSYLAAIGNFDYVGYLPELKNRLEVIRAIETTDENEKHLTEEMRELTALIVRREGVSAHKFTGWNEAFDVVLLTNRNFADKTRDELVALVPNAKTKVLGTGVRALVDNLNWIRDVRTYQELLFVVKGMESCRMEPEEIARTITGSKLFDFMMKSHSGEAPYYFRLEMKSKKDLGQKSAFLKKLSSQIEKLSERKLINTTDNYEFELRLIENKQGNCNMMIKLYTLNDTRFSYRGDVIPTSIKPVNAALTVALAKEYMKEDAQVLDPFCGVGTMLIERNKAVRANTKYGIDILEEAILKARGNTGKANQTVHYINRDFFQFQHDYLFDEIITNMPFQIGRYTEEDVSQIYERFFPAAAKLLKKEAIVILYSHNREIAKQMTFRTDFHLLKEYEISKREGTYVMVFSYKK